MIFSKAIGLSALLLSLLIATIAFSEEKKPWRQHDKPAAEAPPELKDIGITENLGQKLDTSLTFTNEAGQTVALGQYFDGKRPVLLSLVYYNCPGLCNFVLNGATETFSKMDWELGNQFDMVVVSIDPKENAELAQKKKENYLKELKKPGAERGWHFLTGSEENIKKLAAQVGFAYKWDEATEQWAHSAALYALSPDARIMRYLYGISYEPKTVRLSLVEASEGKAGSVIDKLILQCFQYNPNTRGYAFYAYNIVRAGGAIVGIFIAAILLPIWVRERRRSKAQGVVS